MNQQIKAALADASKRHQALDEVGQWAKDTCLMCGSEASTAYIVAALLVEGIQNSWEPKERKWKRNSPQKKAVPA